jgi:hypothetical protein
MRRNDTYSTLPGRHSGLARLATQLLIATIVAACGGGTRLHAEGGGTGTITGLVVVGPVKAATVTAYALDPKMNRGAALAEAVTTSEGTFTLNVPPYNGALELVAIGGSYPDEAVGVPVQLTHELSFVIPTYQSGASVTATISAISSVARSLAKAGVARGSSLTGAVDTAWTHVNAHFGALDWRTVVPTYLSPSAPIAVTMSDGTRAGLILAGFSQAARTLAETSGLSPGTGVTGATLAGAGSDDAQDGTLDGFEGSAAISQGTVKLSGQTFRGDLAEAILDFVTSTHNKTSLTGSDIWSLATAIAANNDPYLFCQGRMACVNLLPPDPSLRIGLGAYYDERSMTLTTTAVPAPYQFPPGAPKSDPVTQGVYKATTRLAWGAQPSAAELEGANPDNIPFVQVRIPVGGSQLPIATVTYAIDDGTYRYTGSLDPWKSPQSTITNIYYDIPLSANTVPSLSGTGPDPRTLALYVMATDIEGNMASNVHVGTISFHLIGPPLYVAEDTQFATYASLSSTFGYTIGAHTYDQLWNPAVTYFTQGMVRLVRYVISNPAPYPVAIRAAFTITGTQGWRMTETWKRFNGGRVSSTKSVDGNSFGTYYCQCVAGYCSSSAPGDCRWANPCGGTTPFGHILGSATPWACPPSAPANYSGTEPAFTIDASSTTSVAAQLFANPSSRGGETQLATVSDGYDIIPAAYGSTPGQLVLYLVRPAALPRAYSAWAWNKFTNSGRYECPEQLAYYFDHVSGIGLGSNVLLFYFYGYNGAVYLQSSNESLSETASLTTRGVSGAFAFGEITNAFVAPIDAPSLSAH